MADILSSKTKELEDSTKFEFPLSKAAHRNPDIHQRGDTLPESLLEYIEGSGTLNPDVAGNTPQMVRARQQILGNGAVQACTTALVQLANLTATVFCPIQAAGTPFIQVDFSIQLDAIKSSGATANYGFGQINANGIGVQGSRAYLFKQTDGEVINAVALSKSIDVPVSPGSTTTINVLISMLTNTTPEYVYTANNAADRSFLSTKLFY